MEYYNIYNYINARAIVSRTVLCNTWCMYDCKFIIIKLI